MRLAVTYPPLCERSVLLPERPELMEKSVGDCLSVMLQEDMLMGRDRLYGSRFNAEADTTVKSRPKHFRHTTGICVFSTRTFALSQFLLTLMGGFVRSSTSSQRLRDKSVQERQRGIHLDTSISFKVLFQFSTQALITEKMLFVLTSNGSLEASRGSTRAFNSESWLRCCSS